MTALVTGAAGFIGFATARALLARGDTVVGLDIVNNYYAVALKERRLALLAEEGGSRFRLLRTDFADMTALNAALAGCGITRVVHLGAQAGVRHSIDHPHAYLHANLAGHLNILEWARRNACQHLVYASSSSVYGGNTRLPFSVDDRVDRPVSLYAATKRADELMSESYAHLYRLPQTGLRFFTVYGPWGRPDMAMWLWTDAVLSGRPVRLFNRGDMRRDFTYIDDIVAGVLAALDHPPADDGKLKAGGSTGPHRLYNIGNHRSEPIGRVVTLIEQALNLSATRELLPMQPGDVPDSFADIDAIAHDLGFAPATSIDEGVPRFVRWFRDYTGR